MGSADSIRFLNQNDIAAATLTAKEIDGYAEHHAGGLYVLMWNNLPNGYCMKMHDTWGDPADGAVVLHIYDPENPDDAEESMLYYATGSAAFEQFLAIVEANEVIHPESRGDAMPDINMLDVTRTLLAQGVPVELENTGGGVMCIYAGPKRTDASGETRHAALLGPGYCRENEDATSGMDFMLDINEMYLGTDDEGETDPVSLHELGVTQVSQIVRAVIAQTRVAAGTAITAEQVRKAIG